MLLALQLLLVIGTTDVTAFTPSATNAKSTLLGVFSNNRRPYGSQSSSTMTTITKSSSSSSSATSLHLLRRSWLANEVDPTAHRKTYDDDYDDDDDEFNFVSLSNDWSDIRPGTTAEQDPESLLATKGIINNNNNKSNNNKPIRIRRRDRIKASLRDLLQSSSKTRKQNEYE